MDPRHRIFSGRFARECLKYREGTFVKDLNYLNRDLRNLIIIEKDINKVQFHTDNAIIIPEFTGNPEDRELIDLIPFLEHLAKKRTSDVRNELNKYGHTDTGKRFLNDLAKFRD